MRITPHFDERREVERLFEPLQTERLTKRGNLWFAAVTSTGIDHPDYDVPAGDPVTWIAIIITNRYRGEWCYKDITECMGPAPQHCRCPVSIIKLASPVKPGTYAHEFRERCRAWHNRPKPTPGETYKLAEPVFFGGVPIDTVTRADWNRNVFHTPEVGYIRLQSQHLVGAERINS